jgi:RimJ/RimL family protein N-acetyltransferase
MPHPITLRPVRDDDLPIFFEQERDPQAVQLAAFTHPDPNDRAAFDAHWAKIRARPSVRLCAIEAEGVVVGHVASYEVDGRPEVTYWLGREYWGRGLATAALRAFLAEVDSRRPMFGHTAQDNLASRRVMEKCGFRIIGQSRGYANARGQDIDELELVLE